MDWPVIVVAYPVLIPDALRHLEGELSDFAVEPLDEVADGIARRYQEEIEAVHAIDSRHFIDTVSSRAATRRDERIVKSDAEYSGVVEHGWITRAKGQDSYPGRFPAARAVASVEDIITDAYSRAFNRR